MKHKTRILTLRTLSVLILVALLAALSPPALQNGGVALAQTVPTLTATPSGPNSIMLEWSQVSTADSYRVIRWTSGQTNWSDVGGALTTTTYDDDRANHRGEVLLQGHRRHRHFRGPVVRNPGCRSGLAGRTSALDHRRLGPDRPQLDQRGRCRKLQSHHLDQRPGRLGRHRWCHSGYLLHP